MSDISFLLVTLICLLVLLAANAYCSYLSERTRTQALSQVAEGLGFAFYANGDKTFLLNLPRLHLFSQGRNGRLTNLMQGTFKNTGVAIFDYRYVTGSGRYKHTWYQTVICFELDGLFLPAFSLRPENIWHKVRSWLGYQDIDFEGYPTFSARYLLRGADEEAIRAVFTDRILGFYEATSGLCTEGNEDRLLFYRQPVRVKPEDVRAFMKEGLEVLSQFCPSASSGIGWRSW